MGGSGLDWTDDFQKFCGSGLDWIQLLRIRIGLGLKNFTVRSCLVVPQQPLYPVFCFEGQNVPYPVSSFLPDIKLSWRNLTTVNMVA